MAGRLWITTPIMPGVQDAAELERLVIFIARLPSVPAMRLISYHRLGESKCGALGRPMLVFDSQAVDLLITTARTIYLRHGWSLLMP